MGVKISNIKLDKEKYVYWIDSNMILSFIIESDKNETIDKVVISYWYDFYWNLQEQIAFSSIIEEKDKYANEKISFVIPIVFFNFNLNNLQVQNYIKINIKNWIIFNKDKETLFPNIIIDETKYLLKNSSFNKKLLTQETNIDNKQWWENYFDKVYDLIVKTDDVKYDHIQSNIRLYGIILNSATDSETKFPKEWSEIGHKETSDKINSLIKERNELLIIREDKINEHKRLLTSIEELSIKLNSDNKDPNILNDYRLLEKEIYKCYKSKNDLEYNNILDYYYDKSDKIVELDNLWIMAKSKQEILKNKRDFVLMNKKFKWFFVWKWNKLLETKYCLWDCIHRDVYDNLRQDLFVKNFDKLVRSNIYNIVYGCSFILIIIYFVDKYTGWYFDRILWELFGIFYHIIFMIFPLLFIFLSKLLERLYNKKIFSLMYDFKLNLNTIIKNNIENKLFTWKLTIYDIFERFNVKIKNKDIDYNFELSLTLNLWTVYNAWKINKYLNEQVYKVTLFKNIFKWSFDVSKIQLLENNYQILSKIMPNSNKNKWTKIYYTLNYKLDSTYLPDLTWSMDLYLNFDNK